MIKKNSSQENDLKKKKKKLVHVAKEDDRLDAIVEQIVEIPKIMSPEGIALIIESLKSNFLFKNLNETEYDVLIRNMFYCKIDKDSYVFKQQDEATCFFVVDQGQVDVIIDGDVKKTLGKGASFGELALLYNAPRSASIRATKDTFLWGIHRKIFKQVLKDMNDKEKNEIKQDLDQIEFLSKLTDSQKTMLANNTFLLKYQPGQAIVNKGDIADSFYLVKSGKVGCYNGDQFIRYLEKGDSFGEQALYKDGV